MQMKTCPACGTEVPTAASRCKNCFHDFTEPPKKRNLGPLAILIALAALGLIAAGVHWTNSQSEIGSRVLVEQGSQSVQVVREFANGTKEAHAIPFAEVSSVEFVERDTSGEIFVVTLKGDKIRLSSGDPKELRGRAEDYARAIGKPMTVRNETEYTRTEP